MSLGYIVYNGKGSVTKVSPCLCRVAGLDDGAEGQRLSEILDARGEGALRGMDCPGVRGVSLLCRNGEVLRCMASVCPLDSEERSYIAELFLNDRFEEKSLEDDRHLQFLATVSHELRVPLNGIIGFTTLLENSRLDRDQRRLVERLQSSNYLLKGLIKDIIEYTRIRSAEVDLVNEAVQVDSFLSELVGLFVEQAKAKDLELSCATDERIPPQVSLPRLRVMQVLSNLLSNAIKFTEAGSVRVEASLCAADREDRIAFEVVDTGPGIAEGEQAEVFRPFGQSKASGVMRTEGSGLGLAISKGLVELMGGSLEYAPGDPCGSVFRFSIPFGEAEPDAVAEQAKPEPVVEPLPGASAEPKPDRILIVEDNHLNADIISHFMREFGYRIDWVDNGRKAVDAYEDGKYALILMDIMLPEMNGYEATEKIMEKKDPALSLPVVGVTAKVFRADHQRCMDAGMVDVVHKPIDFQRLRQVLARHLGIRGGLDSEGTRAKAGPEGEEAERPESEWPGSPPRRGGVLDRDMLEAYLARMCSSEEEKAEQMEGFVRAIEEQLGRLRKAMDRQDSSEIERLAHLLKGSLGLIGAWDMQDLALGAEGSAARAGDSFRPTHWMILLESSFHELKHRLASLGYSA